MNISVDRSLDKFSSRLASGYRGSDVSQVDGRFHGNKIVETFLQYYSIFRNENVNNVAEKLLFQKKNNLILSSLYMFNTTD